MASSLNQTHAYDPKKIRHFGKLFGTIDFEMNENLSGPVIRQRQSDTTVGSLFIGERSFNLTIAEIERVIETLQNAREVFYKSYTLGRYN